MTNEVRGRTLTTTNRGIDYVDVVAIDSRCSRSRPTAHAIGNWQVRIGFSRSGQKEEGLRVFAYSKV